MDSQTNVQISDVDVVSDCAYKYTASIWSLKEGANRRYAVELCDKENVLIYKNHKVRAKF